jgi:MFS superfamily sulfate permease-like transporter
VIVVSPETSTASTVDALARSVLQTDYRIYGGCILGAVVLFLVWRRWRYKEWPSFEQCIVLITALLAILGAITIALVFLFTSPPAVDVLPKQSILLIGLLTPIAIFYYVLPRLHALLFPPEVGEKPPPPKDGEGTKS